MRQGEVYDFSMVEETRIECSDDIRAHRDGLRLRREGFILVLENLPGGSVSLRVACTHASGEVWDNNVHLPGLEAFDSADPTRDSKTAHEFARGYMNDVNRAMDVTISKFGRVLKAVPPANGWAPHWKCKYEGKPWYAAVERQVLADYQKLLVPFPESEIWKGGYWVIKHQTWDPNEGPNLGPFSMKYFLSALSDEEMELKLSRGEATRDFRARDTRSTDILDDPAFGPYKLEIEGSLRVHRESRVLRKGTVNITLLQNQRGAVTKSSPVKVRYSGEFECRGRDPVQEKEKDEVR